MSIPEDAAIPGDPGEARGSGANLEGTCAADAAARLQRRSEEISRGRDAREKRI